MVLGLYLGPPVQELSDNIPHYTRQEAKESILETQVNASLTSHDLGPFEPVLVFNKQIVDATANQVCAYKPNLGIAAPQVTIRLRDRFKVQRPQ
jgi:hypothetical protein